MAHKIFLSHNHKDKPLVEAVALKLADIFGQEQIFYDSWSIKPGDGIIDQMSKGLETPEFVFFFVSSNSLLSGMVKIEWQNALFEASKGKMRIIPVRVDGSEMPAVLRQTLFIDMHTIGLDAAIVQIVNVTQGNASFTPQHEGFSNLTFIKTKNTDGSIDITIKASHLMEPNLHFAFATMNSETEISWSTKDKIGFYGGFNKDSIPLNGNISGRAHAISMRLIGGVLTPTLPVGFTFGPKGTTPIEIFAVYHQKGENQWAHVPVAQI